jgi:hypothetical protein
MLHVSTSDSALRPRREPDEHARIGAVVLGLDKLKPRARLKAKKALRYCWFAGRNGALSAIGIIAEEHGPIAARMCADAALSRLAEGLDLTTREAAYVAREAAHRLTNVSAVNGQGGRP